MVDLGQRKAGVGEVGDLGEERVVAPGGLGATLDHVPGHHRARDPVVVARFPAEVGGGGSDHD